MRGARRHSRIGNRFRGCRSWLTCRPALLAAWAPSFSAYRTLLAIHHCASGPAAAAYGAIMEPRSGAHGARCISTVVVAVERRVSP